MAIARDTFTAVSSPGSVNSSTFSHTCSGSDRLLLVAVTKRTSDDITGVTYNGVAMTQIIKRDHADSTEFLYIYGLIAPATGANNVIVSASGTSVMYHGVTSYTGVGQTQNLTAITGFSATNAISLTSTVDNSSMFVFVQNSTDNPAASTGSTKISETNGVGMFESSPLLITPAGSKTMNYTGTNNDSIGVIFEPVTTVVYTIVAATGTFILTGVSANIGALYTLVASVGSFILTGIDATFRRTGWANPFSKNEITPTNTSKTSSTWTNRNKNT